MDLQPLAPSESQSTFVRIMEVTDANLQGNVHGGVIMREVDSAAGLAAVRHSRGPAVTAVMDEMAFLQPVRLGDVLTCKSSVNWTGHTSMEVGVRITAQRRGDFYADSVHVGTAYLVFVAVNPDGSPRPIPPLAPVTPEDFRRQQEAIIRRESRLARRAAILTSREG